jgi:NADH dehydrogenase
MNIFVAGSTGATGQVFVPMAEKAGHRLTLHVRPKSKDKTPLGKDPRARVFELEDDAALDGALTGQDAVVSFVGTMRNRFSQGDDYATSDVGSAKRLAASAKRVGVPRMLLLSSVGAGGMGAYLKMKLACEDAVRDAGLSWTFFRPSILVSPDWANDGSHGKREAPFGTAGFLGAVGFVPGLRGVSLDYKPIPIERVCKGFLDALENPARYDGKIVLGRDLWALPLP